jgi:HlyD family secretion protein
VILNKNLKRVLLAVAVVLAALVVWRLIQHFTAPKVNYETGVIDRGAVEKSISSTGSVDALVTVEVGSQISGQISELHADFNSPVKKGDLLAVIDPQTYQQRVASAEADVAVARATVGSQQASLSKAQTTVEQAQRDYDRQQQLAAQKLIAESAAEDSRKQLALAKSDVVIAQAQVKNAQAALQTRQSALEQARIDLSRTQIRAPIDGIVISRSVDLGQTVAASLQAPVLFKIAQDLSQIQIEAKVDEADIGSIRTNDPASFTVDAYPDQNFTGQVAQVRLAATTVQNVVTYSVMVQARNPRQMLLPGMTANVSITTDRRENVLRVPNDATRFKPIDEAGSATGNQASNGTSGSNRSDRNFLDNDQMLKDLNVSKEQQEKLRKVLQATFQQLQSQQNNAPAGLGGQGGQPNFRQQNQQAQATRNRFENALASVLTPEQMDKFRKLNNQRGPAPETRSGTLYTLDGGKPKSHDVTFGVADDRFTEIVDAGQLKAGDTVILRARTEVGQ